jgi:phosphate/sulfate permease
MPLLYGITAQLGNNPLGSNFFLTLVVSFLGGCYSDSWIIMKKAWGLILGPLLGCLVGALFFEYFYKAVAEAYKEELDEEKEEVHQQEEERKRYLQR